MTLQRASQNRRVEHPPWRGLSPFCGVRGAKRGLSPSPKRFCEGLSGRKLAAEARCGEADAQMSSTIVVNAVRANEGGGHPSTPGCGPSDERAEPSGASAMKAREQSTHSDVTRLTTFERCSTAPGARLRGTSMQPPARAKWTPGLIRASALVDSCRWRHATQAACAEGDSIAIDPSSPTQSTNPVGLPTLSDTLSIAKPQQKMARRRTCIGVRIRKMWYSKPLPQYRRCDSAVNADLGVARIQARRWDVQERSGMMRA
jgi:hypothetical protein